MTDADTTGGTPAPGPEGPEPDDGGAGDDDVTVRLNGEERRIPRGCTTAGLLRELELDPGGVVVEVNREIVRRERLEETTLEAGDRVEIVRFVGGG